MKKEDKKQLIDSLAQEISARNYLYITDISGLNAEDTSKLRRLCFKKEVKLIVAKNTLLKRALEMQEGRDLSELFPTLKGASAIMLSDVNNAPAKLIREFRGNGQKPILKSAFVEECVYVGDDQLDALINVKSKNDLIGELVGLLQSPMQNVLSQLQSGGNTIHGLLKTLEEKAA